MIARQTFLFALLSCTGVLADRIPLRQADLSGEPELRAVIPIDSAWHVLDELMSAGAYYAPIYTYTSATPFQIDVTDLFTVSDRNEVYVDGALLGATPAMPDWQWLSPPVGPLDPPYTSNPAVAWLQPEFSKASFVLPAGTHLLTLRNIHIPLDVNGAPFADGTVAFRLVPEPTTCGLLLVTGLLAVRRRSARKHRQHGRMRRDSTIIGRWSWTGSLAVAVLLTLLVVPGAAHATPCGTVQADVIGGVLEIQGTTGPDSLRVALSASDPAVVEVFTPATAVAPSCTYDSAATPFSLIHVVLDAGDDLVVFDDSHGTVSDTWTLSIDGGDGKDVVLGGIDLSTVPLTSALSMIDTLQQARDLMNRVLDLLDTSPSGCSTAPCLVTGAAGVVKSAGHDLILPTAHYVRDIERELVQPSANAVRDAHDRIAGYLQTFLAGDVQALSADAQTFTANVEVMVDQFELLLPVAQNLLARAQTLYAHASGLGLSTQGGDPASVFMQTIESHVTTIVELADQCDEDPEPAETEFNEDLQDPNGLSFFCAEAERRIEALEGITDGVEAHTDQVEAEGDAFETDGDALAASAAALGDDENPSSAAAQLATQGDQLVTMADNLSATADALNADWEQWVGQVEADLEGRGNLMYSRGQTEVLGAASVLEAQAQADVANAADALRVEADQIVADLEALLIVAAPLLRDDLSLRGARNGCQVAPTHTITGGPGSDVLIGSTGSDLISGGDGDDLIVGAGGADRLLGDNGNDLIFGGGGADEIHGGPDVDILIGNKGDDCIFGGGGQTITRGSLSVELGDIFFGLDGNDTLVSGESENDTLTEIDVAFGGAGDDRIRLSHGGTLTVGSFSFEFGNLAFGNAGADDILTADGVDVIFGGADDDTLQAGRGAQLAIGSGSGAFRLALGDLLFGGDGADTIDSDDPNADRADDDIDVVFGGTGNDTIHGYSGGLLSIGDPNSPDFELRIGNVIFGGDNNDTIVTLDGIDVIFGGAGDDTVTAGKGDLLAIGTGSNAFRLALGDLIFAGTDADVVHGDDPDADRADDDIDVIFGAAGADTIHGYGGGLLSIGDPNDPDFELRLGNVIFGGDDDDELDALAGIDLIFGGDGNDLVSAGKGDVLQIDDTFKIDLGDLIFGQSGDDTLHGDAADPPGDGAHDGIDVVFGGPGDDLVYGGSGGNIELPDQNFCLLFGNLLFGGPDNDLLRGDYENGDPNDPQGGIDLIFGAGGDDTIEGGAGSLIVVGDITAGQAVIIGFGNLLFGGPGDDVLKGADNAPLCTGASEDLDNLLNNLGITDLGGAADLIFAGPGSDTVDAYNGIDFVFGSTGDDVLRADNGGFVIVPISGVPTPIALGNLMFGGDGQDTIRSLGRLLLPTVPPMEIDLLFGGPCDDNISAGDGFNLVFGNRANDTITAGDGINLLFGSMGDDVITAGTGLNVAFGNRDNDIITADDGVNVLFGNLDDDAITGGNGLNIAFGNRGNDVVQAGAGVAILFGNSGQDQVTGGDGLTLAFGNRDDDIVRGGNGLAVLFGNTGNDDVAGAAGLCVAFGNADHDLVSAGAGLAVLFGNAGQDRLTSGPGLSVLFGNRDDDILQAGGGGLFVAFGNADQDVIVGGSGMILGFGNAGNDQFFGGSGVNLLFGNNGDDTVRGGGGTDFLFGNRGNDQISAGGGKDFVFGNRDDDCLSSDGGGDYLFGNRGNDQVRSGSDGECDWLFGNRGNDSLYRCQNCDKRYGGRGSDTKSDSCDGCSLATPARGEVRGTVRVDLDGDGIGDVGQPGVTVSAGASTAVTDADGNYRIAGLAVGGYSVSEAVPAGYLQISTPVAHTITVGSLGIDLFQHRDFVNRENCHVAPDAWTCLGAGCNPPDPGCKPILVQRVLRCPQTGAICDEANPCPCGDCVPSWAVVECACNPECYIVLDPVTGPQCSGVCIGGGAVTPCQLVQDGDFFHCACLPPPCPTEFAQFFFTGTVTNISPAAGAPTPWDNVQLGAPWSLTYLFSRTTPDQNPSVQLGEYPAIAWYQLQVGPISVSGVVTPGTTLIRNTSNPGVRDQYEAFLPLNVGGFPPANISLLLDNVGGTAWTLAGLNPRDRLPLCADIVLDRFPRRLFRLDGVVPPDPAWGIVGIVTAFECTDCAPPPPAPSVPRRAVESTTEPQMISRPAPPRQPKLPEAGGLPRR